MKIPAVPAFRRPCFAPFNVTPFSQIWMRLSRYQRYLLLIIIMIMMVLVYNYWGTSNSANGPFDRKRNEEVIIPDPLLHDRAHVEANIPESNGLVDENSLEHKRQAIPISSTDCAPMRRILPYRHLENQCSFLLFKICYQSCVCTCMERLQNVRLGS